MNDYSFILEASEPAAAAAAAVAAPLEEEIMTADEEQPIVVKEARTLEVEQGNLNSLCNSLQSNGFL